MLDITDAFVKVDIYINYRGRIKDNYIKFWFAFVYPNLSFLESGNSQIVMDKIKKGFISGQVAFVYEDVCRQKM